MFKILSLESLVRRAASAALFVESTLAIYKFTSPAEWVKEKVEQLDIPHFGPSQIEKLSGDNTRVEKERVMLALRTG